METTIVQPGSTPSIYSTGHHGDRHHNDHGHRFDSVEARADFRALTNEVERFGTLTGDRTRDVGDKVLSTSCHTDQLVQGTSARSNEIVQAGFGVVHDRLCDTKAGIVDKVERVGTAGALAACETDAKIADVKFIGMETAKDNLIAMNVGFAAGQNGVNTGFAAQSVLATTIGNAQSVLSQAIGNAASVQATANYNGLTVLGERIRAELAASQAAGFAAAALLAFQNKADSDAKAAKCCCEADMAAARNFAALSAQITADGNVTRALINQNTIDDLRAFKASIPRGIPVTLSVGA